MWILAARSPSPPRTRISRKFQRCSRLFFQMLKALPTRILSDIGIVYEAKPPTDPRHSIRLSLVLVFRSPLPLSLFHSRPPLSPLSLLGNYGPHSCQSRHGLQKDRGNRPRPRPSPQTKGRRRRPSQGGRPTRKPSRQHPNPDPVQRCAGR